MTAAPVPAAPRRHLPVWLPWLVAPAFAFLPVAGCGAAAAVRHGRAVAAASPEPAAGPRLVPVTAVVTALPSGQDGRFIARRPAAN